MINIQDVLLAAVLTIMAVGGAVIIYDMQTTFVGDPFSEGLFTMLVPSVFIAIFMSFVVSGARR